MAAFPTTADATTSPADRFLATLDRAEEELLGLALAAGPPVPLPAPLPQLATFLRSEFVVGGPRSG